MKCSINKAVKNERFRQLGIYAFPNTYSVKSKQLLGISGRSRVGMGDHPDPKMGGGSGGRYQKKYFGPQFGLKMGGGGGGGPPVPPGNI